MTSSSNQAEDDTKMQQSQSQSQPLKPAPTKRPDLVSRGSAQNITGGLDGFLRGAAMTFNQSSKKSKSNSFQDEDEEGDGDHSDDSQDSELTSDSDSDSDDEDHENATSNQRHGHGHRIHDQESEIEKKLKESDKEALRDAKASNESGGGGAEAVVNDPLGSGSGSLSSGERANPLDSISLTPLPSREQIDGNQVKGSVVNQVGNREQNQSLRSDSKEEVASKNSAKESSQSQIIDESKRKEVQVEDEKDLTSAKEKGKEAQKKESKKRKALGRLIRRTRGTNDHHHPTRGMSMLDEDDNLIRALNSQAIDSLEEAGEEAMDEGDGPTESHQQGNEDDDADVEDSKDTKQRDSMTSGSSTQVEQEEEKEKEKEKEQGQEGASSFSKLRPIYSRSGSSKRSIQATNFDARRDVIDPEEKKEKLEALIQEFGESPCLRGQEPEKLLATCPAVLMRTVLIKGSLIVTSHRVAFVAFLPTSKANNTSNNSTKSAEDPPLASHPDEISPILKKGPATVHRQGWRRKRKGWFELRADCITHYPSSDKLYHPIGSLRLDGIDEILPVDWKHPNRIGMKVRGRTASLELKTEEAALEWRRELEAALWNFRNEAEKIRICVPLERILHYDHSSYLHFAVVGHLYVMNDDDQDSLSDQNADSNNSSTLVAFGVTHKSAFILDVLSEAFKEPHAWRQKNGDKVFSMTRSPTIEVEGPRSKDQGLNEDSEKGASGEEESLAVKFVNEFSLRATPSQLKLVKADLVRTIPIAGTLAIGLDVLVFWRPRFGHFQDTKLRIPLADITGIESARAFRFHYYGVRVHIRGHPDLCIEFGNRGDRDETLNTMSEIISKRAERKASEEEKANKVASKELDVSEKNRESNDPSLAVQKGMERDPTHTLLNSTQFSEEEIKSSAEHYHFLPKVVNSERHDTRDIKPMNIVCLTIGSRGDVQPFIALCKGFKSKGHFPTIVSHPEYRKFVESNGINFRPAGGDPGALMALSVEHKMFSPGFFRESIGQFRDWLDELLRECWEQSQGADLIIESPQTFAGVHVAEALGCKFFRAAAMTWTRTSSYPQAFSVPPHDLGASYNLMSYSLFDQILWRATSSQINRWRKHMLELQPTDLTKLAPEKVPFMYNFTENLVPFPNDWGDRVAITGYWELTSEAEEWTPPQGLEDFMEKAKKDGKKLCYIGFGSITVDDAESVTAHIYDAVKQADVRAIVAKGWSGRMSKKDKDGNEKDEVKIPEECYVLDSIPHDWLFPKIDIALHHGGAGTTGASLRAGLVTLIKPFFGDQFFWASQVRKVGAGTRVASLDVSDLKSALEKAAKDRIMAEKAADVGEKIRKENGVENAIRFVYNNLLSAQRTPNPLPPKGPSRSSTMHSRRGSSLSKAFTFSEEEDEEDGTEEDEKDRTTLTSRSLRLVSSPLALARSSTNSSTHKEKEKESSSTLKKTGSLSRRDTNSSTSSSKDGGSTPTSSTVSTPGPASRRDTSSSTITEEAEEQDEDSKPEDNKKPEKSSSFFTFSHARVPSLTGALGALLPNASEETPDEEESDTLGTPRAEKAIPTSKGGEKVGEKDGEKEEKKEAYSRKRAKAEDIRRRDLLKERLRKEREEREGILSSGGESGNTSKEDLKLN